MDGWTKLSIVTNIVPLPIPEVTVGQLSHRQQTICKYLPKNKYSDKGDQTLLESKNFENVLNPERSRNSDVGQIIASLRFPVYRRKHYIGVRLPRAEMNAHNTFVFNAFVDFTTNFESTVVEHRRRLKTERIQFNSAVFILRGYYVGISIDLRRPRVGLRTRIVRTFQALI